MRTYSKISPKFWIGPTGREIRKLGTIPQLVAVYLLTSPHANLIGLYHLPILYIAADTGIETQDLKNALISLETIGFCQNDFEMEMVWVVEMARYQCLDEGQYALKPADNRVKAIRKEYASLPKSGLLLSFSEKYSEILCLDTSRVPSNSENEAPYQAPLAPLAAPLASQEQEQEQEQETLSQTSAEKEDTGTSTQVEQEERDVGKNSDSREPSIEFVELRQYYDKFSEEAEQIGFIEYCQLRAARAYPGHSALFDAIDAWGKTKKWQEGYAPSLARFLREKWWRKLPRASPEQLPDLHAARIFVGKYGQGNAQNAQEALANSCCMTYLGGAI